MKTYSYIITVILLLLVSAVIMREHDLSHNNVVLTLDEYAKMDSVCASVINPTLK